MRKQKAQEEPMQQTAYNDLFTKIDSLAGVDRKKFCDTLTKEEKQDYIRYLKEKDCEMVTGVFRCTETPGGFIEFSAMAYPGETPVKYPMYDGEKYTVPRYVARRLENEFQGVGCWYPTNKYILDDAGKPLVHVGKKNRRFGFSSMDFQ